MKTFPSKVEGAYSHVRLLLASRKGFHGPAWKTYLFAIQ